MEYTAETVAPREVEFTIHLGAEEVDEARRKAARAISQRVRIPGFRPGKAPYALVERTVGKEYLTEEAAEILAPDLFERVMQEGGYEAYDRPTLRVSQQEPFELKIRVPLRPTVELADYHAIHVEPEPEVQVTPEQVQKVLDSFREDHGTWVPVERPVQMGDQVIVDIKGTSDSETLFDEKEAEFELNEKLIPAGLAEGVTGMSVGETRQVAVTYPVDFAEERLAGKSVDVTVTLRGAKEQRLPELDDEFARTVGGFASIEELQSRIRQAIKMELQAEAEARVAQRVLEAVIEQSRLEYPNQAVEREIDYLIRQRERRLQRQGFTLEGYLSLAHKSLAQLRDELRPEAEERLRHELVLDEVARAEGIEVSPEEVHQAVGEIAASYGERADEMRRQLMREDVLGAIVADLRGRKALARLVEIVAGRAQSKDEGTDAAAPEQGAEEGPATGEQQPE
ncbi:MAG: trigger factor [Anaerolineae bacterium]|nr:trigger factor [Anaerolineae bacterium]